MKTAKGKAAALTYDEGQLAHLRDIHCELVRTEMLNYGQGGSIWRRLHGVVADTPVSPLLRMTADAFGIHGVNPSPEHLDYLWRKLGCHLASGINENDSELFEQLAVVLRARKANRPIHSITAKELKMRRTRGRKPKIFDLSRAFPLALLAVTMKRSRDHAPDGEFTDIKISRSELLRAIQAEQRKSGLRKPPQISQTELSRQIAEYKFQPFMAEKPIARKSAKIG